MTWRTPRDLGAPCLFALFFLTPVALAQEPAQKRPLAAPVAPGAKPLVPTRDTIKPISKPAQLMTGEPKTPGGNRVYYYFTEYDKAMKGLVQTSDVYNRKRSECRARGFAPQEQVSAGCKPTDTVAQCSDKLIAWCTAEARKPYNRSLAEVSAAASRLSKEAADEARTRADYQRMP
jgi:hypothetical protein